MKGKTKTKRKTRKPGKLYMPFSGAEVARVGGRRGEYFFQLSSSGSTEPATARKIARWLIKAAEWMEKRQ